MKNILLFILLFFCVLLISCSQTNEQNAQQAIEKYITSKFNQPVKPELLGPLDSAFVTFFDTKEYRDLSKKKRQLAHSRYDLHSTNQKLIEIEFQIDKIDSLICLKSKQFNSEFIGFKIQHRYKQNLNGAMVVKTTTTKLDKNFNVVTL